MNDKNQSGNFQGAKRLIWLTIMCHMMDASAGALDVSLPKRNYQIPAGDLSDTLPDYAAESGILLGFDPILTQGKRSQALKGQYGVLEGFDTLLKDTGLGRMANINCAGQRLNQNQFPERLKKKIKRLSWMVSKCVPNASMKLGHFLA